MPDQHWANGPGWSRLALLAGALGEIAEKGSAEQLRAHARARASGGDAESWSRGWAEEETIVECGVELRLGAVAGYTRDTGGVCG
jgi:hypothetical protein